MIIIWDYKNIIIFHSDHSDPISHAPRSSLRGLRTRITSGEESSEENIVTQGGDVIANTDSIGESVPAGVDSQQEDVAPVVASVR